MTRDRYSLAGRLGTSNCELLFSSLLYRPLLTIASSVLWLLFIKLQPFSLCLENFEELSAANQQYLFKVSYVLVQNCSVLLFMIGFLSVISKINWTALPCLFSSLLFYSGVAAWSFVGDTGVVYSHKATYLGSPCVQCVLQDAFQACTTSSHKPVFIGLNHWCWLHRKLKELLYSH